MPKIDSPARAIARNVLVVVGVFLVLYVIYLLRQPISWLIIAAFLAVALAGSGQLLPALHEARARDRARLLSGC